MMTPRHLPRLLQRASFGPRPGDREAIEREGGETWLARQLAPERIPEEDLKRRLQSFPALSLKTDAIAREFPPVQMRARAAAGETSDPARRDVRMQRMRRIREIGREMAGARLVRAVHGRRDLEEVMVDFWANHFSVFARKGPVSALLPGYERDVLRPHALGRFEDLLAAVAKSPAMLFYLDNWLSSAERSRPSRRRRRRSGLNENYARELLELHTLGVSGGYAQEDVIDVARTFTGWTLRSRQDPSFEFRGRMHDAGEKRVLGERVRGEGFEQGAGLLRRLARHPQTARHLSRKLARRFVADDPPEALVERLSLRFLETEGDIRAVLGSLFRSPEFADPASRKLRTPLEFVAAALRETGGDTDGGKGTLFSLQRLGEIPFMARTPAGYPDTVRRWMDPGAMLERIEVAFALASGRLPGARLGPVVPEISPRLAKALPAGLAHERRLALVLASPEFQWQ